MGYERNDRGYGRDANRSDSFRNDRYDPYAQDRGFFERAGDEVRSWFGDEEAERRRRYDEQFDDRYDRDAARGSAGQTSPYGAGGYAGRDYPRYDRSNGPDRYTPDRSGYASAGNRSFDGRSGARGPGGYGSGGDRDWRDREYQSLYGNRGASERDTRPDDPHGYHSWREQQISSFDRDYDEYRRENHSRFASEFSAWRENRQAQRQSLLKAQEHQEVVGSDGVHVGKIDHIRGDRILLTKTDRDAGGHHHSIPSSWIQSVDDKVHLSKTAEQAQQAWRDEETNRGLFGNRDQDDASDRGAADLNRSFSGTY